MNPDLSKKALKQIEILCEEGCAEINGLLDKAKNGEKLDRLANFDHCEIKLIITALDEIMSVYNVSDEEGK